MAESKQKKVDTGKALLEGYQREKHCRSFFGRAGDSYSASPESTDQPCVTEIGRIKMDVATLHKKTAQFETLTKKQKELQSELSDKNKALESLQMENQVLLQGHGDFPNSVDENNKMIKELQAMVDGRDTYNKQLCESLQRLSNELEIAKGNEQKYLERIRNLEEEIESITKQCKDKVKNSYCETIGYKAKVELMSKQINEYCEQIKLLQASVVQNNNRISSQQGELKEKDKKLDEFKHSASDQVKQLMSQMESLNHEFSKKEMELIRAKKEVESIENNMKEKFGFEIAILKKELEKKYKEDLKKVEDLYDSMLLKHIRKSKEDLRASEKCSELEAEIVACKRNYEEEAQKYQEELKKLLVKNRQTEEQLLQDLEVQRQEADHYRQQVENIENKLSEEVQKIKDECYLELNKYMSELNEQVRCDQEKVKQYRIEIDSLSVQLKNSALKEAKIEVELETCQNELKKSKHTVNSLLESLNVLKSANEEMNATCCNLNGELHMYKENNINLASKLQQSQENNQKLVEELEKNVSKLNEHGEQVVELGKKYNNAVYSYEQRIEQLKTELDRRKDFYEGELSNLNYQISEQQQVITELESRIHRLLASHKAGSNSCEEQMDRLAQYPPSEVPNDNKNTLIDVLTRLNEIKSSLEVLLSSKPKPVLYDSQNPEIKEKLEHFDESLIEELEKTMYKVLNMTRSHVRCDGDVSFNVTREDQATSPKMITSTPYVRNRYNDQLINVGETSVDSPASNEIIKGWMDKCDKLERENEWLSSSLKMSRIQIKDMECFIMAATKEAKLFDEKCNSFNIKLDELEKSKLNEHILKKENNELKEQLACSKESEQKMYNELANVQDHCTVMEQQNNKHLTESLNGAETDTEIQIILAQLKEKSDEIMFLKAQLVKLQNLEKEHKQRALEAQSKFASLVASYEHLENELKHRNKDLGKSRQENESLINEKPSLLNKLRLFQGKHSLCHGENVNGGKKNGGKRQNCSIGMSNKKEKKSALLSDDLSDLTQSRLETMELLSSLHSKPNIKENVSSKNISIGERIDYEINRLDESLEYQERLVCLATIPEEEFEDKSISEQDAQINNQTNEGTLVPRRKRSLQCHSQLILKQLLSELFDDYLHSVQKLLVPWKEEWRMLELNSLKVLDASTNNKCLVEDSINGTFDKKHEKTEASPNNLSILDLSQETLKRNAENCIRSLFYLKIRVLAVHNAVLSSMNVKKDELQKAGIVSNLQEQVDILEAEKLELEKKHRSAVELLVKDHETELGLVNNLLVKLKAAAATNCAAQDTESVRRELEEKHRKELDELRTYFEKKYSDLTKNQQSCKVSASSSSSDIASMEDMAGLGGGEESNMMIEEKINECCEKKVSELRKILQEKYKVELESLRSKYELRLSESICKICSRENLTSREYEGGGKQQYLSSDDVCSEKTDELGFKYSSLDIDRDLELRVYQIKEEVRKDYECEVERIREEVVAKEVQRKDEEIARTIAQLKEAHRIEKEELWRKLDQLANKEAENSYMQVKTEVLLSQDLDEKKKLVEQLQADKKELVTKQRALVERHQKDLDQLKSELNKAHKKEMENMRQAFDIELKTRIETLMEEKAELEEKYQMQVDKLLEDLGRVSSQSDSDDCQEDKKRDIQLITENIRKDILRTLELQIKAMVASGDESEGEGEWPAELAALERQFTAKYRRRLAQLVEEHELELARVKADYEQRLSDFVKDYELKKAEEVPLKSAPLATGDEDLDKIIRERDNLRCLALTLRQVVRELAGYLTTCEDELNRSFVGELLKFASPHNGHKVQISALEGSSSEEEAEDRSQRKVHFAPDVSNIVSLVEEDCLFDCLESSVDVSLHLRSELQACLERLKDEAAAVLGLTQARSRGLPSAVEDRRLSSVTRQLIEEKKAKEEANGRVQQLEELVQKLEKEAHDLNKELAETRDQMIKEKMNEEAERNERQKEKRMSKLCLLQEKARTLISEKGECPPHWLALIDELCAEGDALIEEAWRARDELQKEVEAADKQLRSTRAFLEEQAAEREQERDESVREICELRDQLRDRERDWASCKQFASEPSESAGLDSVQEPTRPPRQTVEALEQQLREATERLSSEEEEKLAAQKELKVAVDKIWVLRDIISELEVQVSRGGQRETELEQQAAGLEAELAGLQRGGTSGGGDHRAGDDALEQQLHTLQDQLQRQRQGSPAFVRQIRTQLKTMARALQKQIKELEAVNIHVSSASLSSPSEDVSIREQLEALRCATPEEKVRSCGSPPSPLAMEELSHLSDQLLRYSRAAENIIKKLRDRELELGMMRGQCEELQAERDVLQSQSERQLMQLAALNNRVEELRTRNERDAHAKAAPLHQRIRELESHTSELAAQLRDAQRQTNKLKQKLERSEALVLSHEAEISSLSEHQQELVGKLTTDLETMRNEKMQLQAIVEKYRHEDNVSFPQLIEVMLAEKNADIDQLQQRVEELMCQQEHKSKSRGHRVSFADEVSHSRLAEGDRARDAHLDASSLKPYFSTPMTFLEDNSGRLQPRVVVEDISKIPEPSEAVLNSSPNRAVQLETVLSQLKSELEQKTRRLMECEALLAELPVLKQDLAKATEELESTTKSVTEDKQFYEDQLRTLRQTKQLLKEREEELRELRGELALKEEEHVKTTADLRAVHLIMEGLQQKLQEAQTFSQTDFASRSDFEELKKVSDRNKDQCDAYKKTVAGLEEKLCEANKALGNAKDDVKNLQTILGELGRQKQEILSELIQVKSKCKALEDELEDASSKAEETRSKIETLNVDLEASRKENKNLSSTCKKLKNDLEQLTRKQEVELENILKRVSEEAEKDKKELESLKSSNHELKEKCEMLEQELRKTGNNLDLLRELNKKDDKIQALENELKQLEENNYFIRNEKHKTEQDLNGKIGELKSHINDLNRNIVSLETESKDSHEGVSGRDSNNTLLRKYEACKREYEKIRRARREVEKKCMVLKEELAKEKQFSSQLQNQIFQKRTSRLEVTRANIVNIQSQGIKPASSLDNLADQVQQELNVSARLDQTLISGLENTKTVEVVRSEAMPQRLEYLTSRMAEVEMSLHVEKVAMNELRTRLAEEHGRYCRERVRADELQREVATLQTLNDQFEEKFKTVAYQLEEQVNEIKELRLNMVPSDSVLKERQKLKQLMEENQRRVEELLQEREFNRNQLLYLREELAKLWGGRGRAGDTDSARSHGQGDALENIRQLVDARGRELSQELRKSASLQRMLEQANETTSRLSQQLAESELQRKDLIAKVEHLTKQLNQEEKIQKSLEAKIKALELSERNRQSRRKAVEDKLKQQLAESEKEKKELERECLTLQLRLKHSNLQLTAHTAESPLSLRLREANIAVERLVGEKEDLIAASALLREEKADLHKHVRAQSEQIEDLKSRIRTLNVKFSETLSVYEARDKRRRHCYDFLNITYWNHYSAFLNITKRLSSCELIKFLLYKSVEGPLDDFPGLANLLELAVDKKLVEIAKDRENRELEVVDHTLKEDWDPHKCALRVLHHCETAEGFHRLCELMFGIKLMSSGSVLEYILHDNDTVFTFAMEQCSHLQYLQRVVDLDRWASGHGVNAWRCFVVKIRNSKLRNRDYVDYDFLYSSENGQTSIVMHVDRRCDVDKTITSFS